MMLRRVLNQSVRVGLLAVCVAALIFLFASPVAAEESTCTCYCAIEETGATPNGQKTQADCQTYCTEAGHTVAACASSSDQSPSMNVSCWSSEVICAEQGGTFGDNPKQPAECLPGSYYCYPESAIDVPLSVSIGALTSTGDIGEYVSSMYQWLIGAAIFFAIIMVMIGGLQYTLSAGGGDVSKAKKRIMNGVVGLVLLLSAYLILYTVNPQLVKLQVPSFPMVRQLTLSSEDSCGYLIGKWGTASYHSLFGAPADSPYIIQAAPPRGGRPYTIKDPTNGEECGSVATIVTDWEGNEVIPEGSTCTFDYCPTEGEFCVGIGDNARCVKCEEIIPGNEYGFSPSVSTCSGLEVADEFDGNGNPSKINYCFYTNDPHMVVSGLDLLLLAATPLPHLKAIIGIDAATDAAEGTCASLQIDCAAINICEDYATGKLQVVNDITDDELYDLTPNSWAGTVNIQSVCVGDPCRVGAKTGTTCKYAEGTTQGLCQSQ